ncbi:MAG TPA: hypothetical protein VIH72_09325 [Candidatus Acidoferrales bacterium]|jgi:hypothetical protein
MQCREFESVLEQASEQPMPAEATAHLKQCENCRSLTADLEAITAMARELSVPDEEPPARIWTQLRAQLVEEGIIRTPELQHAEPARTGWFAGALSWMRRPVMVAAYAAVMVLVAGVTWLHYQNVDDPNQFPASAVTAQNNLNKLEAQTMGDLQTIDPDANVKLRADLKIVNDFIAVCEKAVREQPKDETARQYLYGAYQQKSQLLAAATEHSWTGE